MLVQRIQLLNPGGASHGGGGEPAAGHGGGGEPTTCAASMNSSLAIASVATRVRMKPYRWPNMLRYRGLGRGPNQQVADQNA